MNLGKVLGKVGVVQDPDILIKGKGNYSFFHDLPDTILDTL